jgi:hypothetical protein
MPYYDGRWHLYSEAERRAFGEARREELRKAWHAKWISKGGLKDRLWTDKAISEFLGKPRDAGPIKAWTRKEVLKAENGMGFKAWMKERRARLIASGKLPPDPPKKPRKKAEPLPDNVIPISRARKAKAFS